jgi:hypothetical protein
VPQFNLGSAPPIPVVAGALRGLVEANRAYARAGVPLSLERLRRVSYVHERPDEWSVYPVLLERLFADCEDMGAWVQVLIEFLFPWRRAAMWITPGGRPGERHVFNTVDEEIFDLAAETGMGRPPDRIYTDPRRVRIA